MIDTNPDHAQLQPENAIVMSPWKGDRKDKDLVGLIPFLEGSQFPYLFGGKQDLELDCSSLTHKSHRHPASPRRETHSGKVQGQAYPQ